MVHGKSCLSRVTSGYVEEPYLRDIAALPAFKIRQGVHTTPARGGQVCAHVWRLSASEMRGIITGTVTAEILLRQQSADI